MAETLNYLGDKIVRGQKLPKLIQSSESNLLDYLMKREVTRRMKFVARFLRNVPIGRFRDKSHLEPHIYLLVWCGRHRYYLRVCKIARWSSNKLAAGCPKCEEAIIIRQLHKKAQSRRTDLRSSEPSAS